MNLNQLIAAQQQREAVAAQAQAAADAEREAAIAAAVAPTPTASDVKSLALGGKLQQKQQELGLVPPTPEFKYDSLAMGGSSGYGQNLIDIAQSSAIGEGYAIGDFISGAPSNLNRQKMADEAAGLDPAFRENLSNVSEESMKSLARGTAAFREGNYLDAATNIGSSIYQAGSVLPELALDSFGGSLASGTAGVLATPVAGAGLGLLAKTGKNLVNVGTKFNKAYEAAQVAVEAEKKTGPLAKVLKTAAKKASQSSAMTTAQLQRMKEDYLDTNGHEMSDERVLANVVPAMVLTSLDMGIFGKVFLPSRKGVKATAKEVQDYIKESAEMLAGVPKSYVKQSLNRVWNATKDVVKAGGMEAGQEYLQTWHEILSTNLGEVEYAQLKDQFMNKKNQDTAFFGGMVGFLSSGALKGTTKVPGLAVGTTLDAGRTVTAHAVDYGKNKAVKASYALLDEGERAIEAQTQEIATKVKDEKVDSLNTRIEGIEKATTLEELRAIEDEDVQKRALAVQERNTKTDADLADPAELSKLKDRLISDYRSHIITLEGKHLTSRGTRLGKVIAKNAGNLAVDKAVAAAKAVVGSKTYDEVAEVAEKLGKATLEEIRNIRSSTARGLLTTALEKGTIDPKVLKKLAGEISTGDLSIVSKTVRKKHPELADQIDQILLNPKKEAVEFLGIKTKEVTNKDNIPKIITDLAAGTELTIENAPFVSQAIQQVLNGKFGDMTTLRTMQRAIRKYKNSKAYKEGSEVKDNGVLNKFNMGIIERKLKTAQANLMKPPGKMVLRVVKKLRQAGVKQAKKVFTNTKEEIIEKGFTNYVKEHGGVRFLFGALDAIGVNDLVETLKDQMPTEADFQKLQEAADEYIDTLDMRMEEAQAAEDLVLNPAEASLLSVWNGMLNGDDLEASRAVMENDILKEDPDLRIMTGILTKAGIKTSADLEAAFRIYPGLKRFAKISKPLREHFDKVTKKNRKEKVKAQQKKDQEAATKTETDTEVDTEVDNDVDPTVLSASELDETLMFSEAVEKKGQELKTAEELYVEKFKGCKI